MYVANRSAGIHQNQLQVSKMCLHQELQGFNMTANEIHNIFFYRSPPLICWKKKIMEMSTEGSFNTPEK